MKLRMILVSLFACVVQSRVFCGCYYHTFFDNEKRMFVKKKTKKFSKMLKAKKNEHKQNNKKSIMF